MYVIIYFMLKIIKTSLFILLSLIILFSFSESVLATSPSGADWFQLIANPYTGSDNTGDGGTGLPADLNYYYVGQTFTSSIQIMSGNTTAANIWIDYNTTTQNAHNLTTGSYFPNWSSQTIANGRVKSTGYRTSGYSNGLGNFGSIQWTFIKPSVAAYGTGSPETLDINVGVIGQTTESNISLNGNDILDDEEDFQMHIWADTVKPYAQNPNPVNASTTVPVEYLYHFELRDSLNGEGDDSGVGTGVDISTPPGVITFNTTDYTGYTSYSCSGVWGTNLCNQTVDPPSPLSIPGDQRNWEYDTLYTAAINSFRDLASPAQDQLGDTNGPNTMNPKSWTFRTEADTVAPRVVSETPTRNSLGNNIATNITVVVHDKKYYPGNISGTGVVSNTCRFDVWSDSIATTTYQQGLGTVTVTAVDYGYQFVMNPAVNFAQNEWVYVIARDCQDVAGNTMTLDNWKWKTSDTDPPYVDTRVPSNDAGVTPSSTISFHVKDDGVGVDLNQVVVYVNGVYYTNGGGAGQVTVNGTRITYASSLDFNGGNYVGDTTVLSGGINDYTFVIDPQANFLAGEAVPVLIYAKDFSNNIMERDVYAMSVGGGAAQVCGNSILEGNEICDDGNTASGDGCSADCLSNESCGNSITELAESCDDGNIASGDGCSATCTYESTSIACGANTTWNGTQCVGTGGGSTGGCSSTGWGGSTQSAPILNVAINSVTVTQVNETTALVEFSSNVPASSRVIYSLFSRSVLGDKPNYGYTYSTVSQEDNSTQHSVIVSNLQPGLVYYFRPLIKANGEEVYGPELKLASLFKATIIERYVTSTIQSEPKIEEKHPLIRYITKPREFIRSLYILKIENIDDSLYIKGVYAPNQKLKITIY